MVNAQMTSTICPTVRPTVHELTEPRPLAGLITLFLLACDMSDLSYSCCTISRLVTWLTTSDRMKLNRKITTPMAMP